MKDDRRGSCMGKYRKTMRKLGENPLQKLWGNSKKKTKGKDWLVGKRQRDFWTPKTNPTTSAVVRGSGLCLHLDWFYSFMTYHFWLRLVKSLPMSWLNCHFSFLHFPQSRSYRSLLYDCRVCVQMGFLACHSTATSKPSPNCWAETWSCCASWWRRWRHTLARNPQKRVAKEIFCISGPWSLTCQALWSEFLGLPALERRNGQKAFSKIR